MIRKRLEELLEQHFQPQYLKIDDVSERHRKHPESQAHGGAHLSITMVAERWHGVTLLDRQRSVLALLAPTSWQAELHALELKLYDPSEWQKKQSKAQLA